MQTIRYTIKGINELLTNNPQSVDPFNKYARAKKLITKKKAKLDEDLLELRRLDIEAKTYFDPQLKVYIPSSWVVASIAANSWTRTKIKKADIRSAVLPTSSKLKLHYDGEDAVEQLSDISRNGRFQKVLLLRQGTDKIAKATPVFNNWSFDVELDVDDSIIDIGSLRALVEHGARYGGYGDFRPSYGIAVVEWHDA